MSWLKHFILVVGVMGFIAPANAQTASWQKRPVWSDASIIAHDLIRVVQDGKSGLVHWDGSPVVDCVFDEITEAQEGYCLLLSFEGAETRLLKGIVDISSGHVLNPSESYSIDASWPYFSEGLLAVKRGKYWGYIAPDGMVKVPCKYQMAFPFSCGLASVRFEDGYFGHIDSQGNVSFGKGSLKSNKFRFASTFVQTESGPMALVAVNGAFYGRNINGDQVKPQLPLGRRATFSRIMSEPDYILEFNAAWQPTRVKTSSKQVNYVGFSEPGAFVPSVASLSTTKETDGFNLALNGNVFLAGQFETAQPLSDTYVLVKTRGRWGVLYVHPYEKVSISLTQSIQKYGHGGAAPVSLLLSLPASISSSPFSISTRINGIRQDAKQGSGGEYQVLADISASEMQVFVQADELSYCPKPIPLKFEYRKGFSIAIPSQVKLNGKMTGNVTVTIANTASSTSQPAAVYLNGVYKKDIEALEPREKVSITLPMKVTPGDAEGDEDHFLRAVSIEIREEGCPAVRNSQTVDFKLYD